jgi:6-pyruvoyltetrahydropterin/6-carboxytetrahydropterin synthase
MLIFKQFTFDSAHYLPNVPEGHKCRQMHGHTYKAIFYIQGEPDPNTGWIMDFGEIKSRIKPLIDLLDHTVLNDIPGLENPTCELICRWLWLQLKPQLSGLAKIELYETPTSGAIFEG